MTRSRRLGATPDPVAAPPLVEFEEVVYWPRIVEIIEWSHQHVTSTLFLCWAVQAALKALYGMEKQTHGEKLSGVYRHHRLDEHEPLLRGFDDEFVAPHSRYAAFDGDLIRAHTDLQIFAESEEAGVYLAATKDCRQVFVTGHPAQSQTVVQRWVPAAQEIRRASLF